MKQILSLILIMAATSPILAQGHSNEGAETREGILLVTFGTSIPSAQVAFHHIEEKVRKAFPETEIRWAYTSNTIRKRLHKQGTELPTPAEALAKMGADGFTHIAVQSLHVIPGEEYENLHKTVKAFHHIPKGSRAIRIGAPLLTSHKDHLRLNSFIQKEFGASAGGEKAVVFMGHGTHHRANIHYPGFQYYLMQENDHMFLGTVEGFPQLENLLPDLEQKGIKEITLLPFMSVAGDHALNDMAGEEEDSWKSQLESKGYVVKPILKGLAEYAEVVDIWIDHLHSTLEALHED
ncbi:MAG: sirohydrochlorin cobaltochelatase [Bacteroidetes bacterium]|nr:MAG: sirohydrochlorin cobaltochelatase [Bacteroidota bacterium]